MKPATEEISPSLVIDKLQIAEKNYRSMIHWVRKQNYAHRIKTDSFFY